MKRSQSTILVLSAALFTGCATTEQHVHLPGDAANPRVSLSQFRDTDDASYGGNGVVHLGAGDSLGREIFVHYLASLEPEDTGERFATGESDVPADR
jgi:hypothetical protein